LSFVLFSRQVFGLQKPPVLPGVNGVETSIELMFYDVDGQSQQKLDQNIRLSEPLGYDAETGYHISPNWQYIQTSEGYKLKFVEISTDITNEYPNWTDKESAPRLMRQVWSRRIQNLEVNLLFSENILIASD
jgi:hypothetical protein